MLKVDLERNVLKSLQFLAFELVHAITYNNKNKYINNNYY